MKPTLAVVILARNEERNIVDCIESVRFADEILVVDSGSEDATCELAKAQGAKVVLHPMGEDGFAGQRNFALTVLETDWVLYLDADERVTDGLREEICAIVRENEPIAGSMQRLSVVMGQAMRHGVYRPDRVLRLFPRTGVTWVGVVHEHPEVQLPVRQMKKPAYHYADRNWEQYFEKFNQYTTMMAQKLQEQGRHVGLAGGLFHAAYAFFQTYVVKLGFLDGRLGFLLCLYHFFYTLTKYVKLEARNRGTGEKQ